MMYENMVRELRNAADEWRANHLSVPTFETRYDLALLDAADAIEDLIAALTASNEVIAKNKPRWIPVTERLPKMGKEVLVSDKQKNVTIAWIVGCFSKDGASFEWACSDGWIDDQLPITHFMPLPEPPKEET